MEEKDEVGFRFLYRTSLLNSFQSRAFRLKRGKARSDLGAVGSLREGKSLVCGKFGKFSQPRTLSLSLIKDPIPDHKINKDREFLEALEKLRLTLKFTHRYCH